jgi:hypothetical protein
MVQRSPWIAICAHVAPVKLRVQSRIVIQMDFQVLPKYFCLATAHQFLHQSADQMEKLIFLIAWPSKI